MIILHVVSYPSFQSIGTLDTIAGPTMDGRSKVMALEAALQVYSYFNVV